MIRSFRSHKVAVLLIGCMMICAGGAIAQSKKSADEAAIREADAQWTKAAGSLDVDKTVAFYSDDAAMLPPKA